MNLEVLARKPSDRVLFYGIGNPGRRDDALGVEVIEQLQKKSLPAWAAFDSNYQLNVEDALLISEYEIVVFVDASQEKGVSWPYQFREVTPEDEFAFTSHSMSPGAVLNLCQKLYGRMPRTFLLAVLGYEWNLEEGLTPAARLNLAAALNEVSKVFDA